MAKSNGKRPPTVTSLLALIHWRWFECCFSLLAMSTHPAAFTTRPATRLALTSEKPQPCSLALAEETPLNLRYNTMQYAVMMVTAQNIEDFCTGFSITEGIVSNANEIKSTTVESGEDYLTADLRIPAEAFHKLMQASRRMVVGRTGCGVCGTPEADQILRPLPALPAGPETSLTAIRRALADLADHQDLNKTVKMVHAAAWCSADGRILTVREDVGRHNALDKLIGSHLRSAEGFGEGFCLLTSRCSYEMVQKAILAGIRTLVSISAPTELALRMAQKAGMTIVAIARPDTQILFTGHLTD